MITAIQNFFNWIVDIFSTVITFLSHTIQGLISFFRMIPKVFHIVGTSISYIPEMFIAFVGITVAISIIYLIVGRQAGS